MITRGTLLVTPDNLLAACRLIHTRHLLMALKRFESSGVMALRLNEERQVDKIKDPIANKCGGGGIDRCGRAANDGHRRAHCELGMLYVHMLQQVDYPAHEVGSAEEGVLWLDLSGKEGYIDCYFRLSTATTSTAACSRTARWRSSTWSTREESDLIKNARDKLPEHLAVASQQPHLQILCASLRFLSFAFCLCPVVCVMIL